MYVASGYTLMDIYYNYRLGYTTISRIIKEVCGIICQYQESFMVMSYTQNDWEKVVRGFEKESLF